MRGSDAGPLSRADGCLHAAPPAPRLASFFRRPQDDYRFGLLWEWNLYDAMLYSPYVASRLQTYTEKGRNMLDLLVAKLGIPLEEAQRSYVGEGCE